jgi:hypothetical protein
MESQTPKEISTDMLAKNEQLSIQTFTEKRGITADSLLSDTPSVILLPPDSHATLSETLVLSEWTKEVRVVFNEAGLEARVCDNGKQRKQLILKSADLVLPTLLFFESSAVTVGLNVLSSWLYDNWKQKKSKMKPSVRVEYLEVDEQQKIKRWCKIEGPADLVSQVLAAEAQREKPLNSHKKDSKRNKPRK